MTVFLEKSVLFTNLFYTFALIKTRSLT